LETGVAGRLDLARAIEIYGEAVDAGSHEAANDLGNIYWSGADGIASDLNVAAQWYERAVAMGNVWARVNLADLLSNGNDSVPQDPERARVLFAEAFELGNVDAAVSLAYLHWDGVGGPVDYDSARMLLETAMAEGHVGALNDLGVMYESGLGVAVDYDQAIEFYTRGVALGDALPASNLAGLFLDPDEGPSDVVEGLAWCYAAIELATDPDDEDSYRSDCTEYAVDLTEEQRNSALARTRELLAGQ